MIAAKSVFARLTFFWLSLTTTVDGGVVPEPAAQFRTRPTADGSFVARLPAIPSAGEENVHMLKAIGFPPPALFFVDPDRKWSMGDFEKPDRATTYSVTDDVDDDGPHDRSTVTTTTAAAAAAGPEEEEKTVTTAANGDDDGIEVGHAEHHLQETTATAGDGHDETTTERNRCDAFATTRRPSVHVGDDHRRPGRPTAILLTSRPLQPPAANYRFPNVDYAVIRRHHTPVVNLHYYV